MAELDSAFQTTLYPNCDMKFDMVSTFTGGGVKSHLGIVTLTLSKQSAGGFKYRVFPGESTPTFGEKCAVAEGTVTDTNNFMFTFPITSVSCDYFVIVTPLSAPPIDLANGGVPQQGILCPIPTVGDQKVTQLRDYSPASRFAEWQAKYKETFAIFYPKKIMKQRAQRMAECSNDKVQQTAGTTDEK